MATTTSVEVAALDATAQAALVRRGEVTAAELVESAIARVEALNPVLNAVVTRTYERACAAVAAVPTGPFAGVPMLCKDLALETRGVRFTEGSRFFRDNVSTFEAELAARYRRAGLVMLGKTNTPEFGMAPACEPALFGPTRNPWNLDLSTSGSSGGSAAAVAAGLVPVAHGNDMGGSIRYPASACGLFGLKPTRAVFARAALRRCRERHGLRARPDPVRSGQRGDSRRDGRSGSGRSVLGAAAGASLRRGGRRRSRSVAHRLQPSDAGRRARPS